MTDPVLEDTITTVPEMKRYLQRMEDETRIQWQTLEGVSIPTLACVKALRLLCQDAKIEKEIADFWRLK
jgi:hypothetical protein